MGNKHHLTARLQRLYSLHAAGIKFGLDAMEGLLARMGHPERELKGIIHVAGSNGKGSVCALAESILRAAGGRTGLYTSPHLVRVNERIKVDGEPIPDDDLSTLIDFTEKHASAYAGQPGGRQVTFFEFITALAFEYFRRQKVEALVLETGLGGRLDATNAAAAQIAVITSISLEHTQYLGPDLTSIAAEKAGIIKPGAAVIAGDLPEEALGVVEKIARQKNARLIRAGQAVSVRRLQQDLDGQKISVESSSASYGAMRLPLLGPRQLANTAMAVAAAEEFCRASGAELPPAAVKKGLSSVSWPGRFQLIARDPLTIIDGAHNPEAASALNDSLNELAGGRPVCLVLGLCSDKDAAGFIRNITAPVSHCWIVALATERSLKPGELARLAASRGWECSTAKVPRAMAEAAKKARETGGIVCATGSFYLAGEILASQQSRQPGHP